MLLCSLLWLLPLGAAVLAHATVYNGWRHFYFLYGPMLVLAAYGLHGLYRLMEGKTVVAIAHRLSTIAAMDRLVVMDKGRIVEEGDHHSLLARGGLYARLWAHQSGGFLGEEAEAADEHTDGRALTVPT